MRILNIVWAIFAFLLLAAGVISIVASVIFNSAGHPFLNMIATKVDFKLGIGLGVIYIMSCIVSVPAFMASFENPVMLKFLNWWLVGCMAVTLAFGSIFWVLSLEQLNTFFNVWKAQTSTIQQTIQDQFSCCGYFNGTAEGGFSTTAGFCSDATFAAAQTGCQNTSTSFSPSPFDNSKPIPGFIVTSATSPGTDFTLETIFSTVYGFDIILVSFFLATVCLINERGISVRFKRIDAKRGGSGFV
ncbi:hypothetical protein L202_03378 [Cryptococcus amylolentus CBS 6039]|uniref:Tetraspanin n=1 Tax=Cryptococcus amylolentus CBS 6039 TaxID=1295533 RepID=A0A1E3HTA4_9TREE|nr:hypothetical protein L202_03378 [Cryptococcus amylolentus CBS 6039]ODN79375.1 hypothetical protein L202_03378 [Cryptococcus amylolentus CBS 6039]